MTVTWTNGTGLQVWDSTGDWWWNADAASPITISSKDNLGVIPGIPPGRTVRARTTYDYVTFSARRTIICPIPSPTPTTGGATSTPTPTPTTGPWIKVKDSSFSSSNNLNNPIPNNPISYDSDDDALDNFIIGTGGLVVAPSVNLTAINPNAKPNSFNWTDNYVPSSLTSPNTYLSYIKSRKEYKVISSLDEITASGIYCYNGNLTLNSVPSQFNSYDVVVVAAANNCTDLANITVNTVNFNPSQSVALVGSSINFSPTVANAVGLFIADTMTTGLTVDQGLKITGNLIVQSGLTNDRHWINANKPSLFIVFEGQRYLDLLPYISTANYEWRQSQ